MNLKELLELAFDAGMSYGQSQTGGTIDEIYNDNGQDFDWFLQNYQKHISSLLPNPCLDEEDLNMDLEIFSDIVEDDSYHYAEMLRSYHNQLSI